MGYRDLPRRWPRWLGRVLCRLRLHAWVCLWTDSSYELRMHECERCGRPRVEWLGDRRRNRGAWWVR